MSKSAKEKDDEFHDAVSNPTVLPTYAKTNAEIIEEILGENNASKLPGEKLPDEEEDEDGENEFHDADAMEVKQTEDLLDDDGDEEEMRELEKSMSIDELQRNKDIAEKLKLDGNAHFKNEQIEEALELYSKALKVCPITYSKDRAILYGNRAAAKIKIDARKSAIDDCTKSLNLWPEYIRVLLRRAKLYELDDKLEDALADYKRVVELDGSQYEAREALLRLPPIINERNERMKEEMIVKLKDLGNMFLKPFGLSTNNFQMNQDPKTGGYSINFK